MLRFRNVMAALTGVDRPDRLKQLDGLRGLAMLLIFYYHFSTIWTLMPSKSAPGTFIRLLNGDVGLGTNFFMMLSGFFAYGTLKRGRVGFVKFLHGRFWRLYPLYFLMCWVYVAGSIAIPTMSRLPAGYAKAAAFIVESLLLLPGVMPIRPLMDVAWTLSYIVFFYFIEGAVVAFFTMWPLSRPYRLLLLACAGVTWALVGYWTEWWLPRSMAFWVGMSVSELVDGIWGDRIRWATGLTSLAVVFVVLGTWLQTVLTFNSFAGHDVDPGLLDIVISALTLGSLIWVAYFGPRWLKLSLSCLPLRLLGAVSYSFYLTHGLTVKFFHFIVIPRLGTAAGVPAVFWISQAAGLVLSVACAIIIHILVEDALRKARLKVVRFHRLRVDSAAIRDGL